MLRTQIALALAMCLAPACAYHSEQEDMVVVGPGSEPGFIGGMQGGKKKSYGKPAGRGSIGGGSRGVAGAANNFGSGSGGLGGRGYDDYGDDYSDDYGGDDYEGDDYAAEYGESYGGSDDLEDIIAGEDMFDSLNGRRATPSSEVADGILSADLPAKPQQRMRHYDGRVMVESKDPRQTVQTAITLAKQHGGYVESHDLSLAELQIPVKNFFKAYSAAAKLGKVLAKSLVAKDISEEYADTKLRRGLISGTLKRYKALLKRARTAKEKLTYLKEIKRLEEDLSYLDTKMKYYAKLSEYSRLVVVAKPQKSKFDELALSKTRTFDWIKQLNPSRADYVAFGEMFDVPAPKNFVVLEQEDKWLAESPTKVQMRTARLKNDPKGDTQFWQKAILHHVKHTDYITGKAIKYKKYKAVMISDERRPGEHYLVAVRADGDFIYVVEVVYPSHKDKKRFHQSVLQSFTKHKFDGGV